MTSKEIERAIAKAGLQPLGSGAIEQFASYLNLLVHWNTKLNLTAIREPAQIVQRHFIECIQCAQALPGDIRNLLDFGSGAGLPGIPIAIARPEIQVTLGESQGKKAAFLREAVRSLSLNAEVYDRRIEGMVPNQVFDAVTLRAVDRMEEATQIALERVTLGGLLIPFATVNTEEALKATLPGVIWERRIAVVGLETGVLLFGRKPCST